ncbi:MAG: site-2 protease family protein [Candidatus Pacebacteria bacterium]|nr:site-2 protease family protein [Candidatus Paceibacterota bacterium]
MEINFLFTIIILLASVIIHEVAHGYSAYMLGDPTAKHAGRLTLNPLAHIDLMGSIIVPLLAFMSAGFMFGWAKPVPYNPYNLSNQKWGSAIVAVAGPASNILVAIIFGLLIRFSIFSGIGNTIFLEAAQMVVLLNLVLAVFNLVPIPPLDGSKILFTLLPYRYIEFRQIMERYSILLIIFFIFFLWKLILPIVFFLYWVITGLSFF